jgi:hypothetical protein
MSRTERIKQYATPSSGPDNWKGAGRDQANIDRWSERAHENSRLAPRAKSTMELPNTGKAELSDTNAGRVADPQRVGKQLDHDPSATRFMPGGVRRFA